MATSPFDRDDLHAPLSEINTTPLVDVMLVLMVIFLVTAPMLTHIIPLELPHESSSEVHEQKAINLSIDSAGQYYWNDVLVSPNLLEQNMQTAVMENPKQMVHIRADSSVPYGKVNHVLAVAAQAGLSNIGFVTNPKNP